MVGMASDVEYSMIDPAHMFHRRDGKVYNSEVVCVSRAAPVTQCSSAKRGSLPCRGNIENACQDAAQDAI
jgi:hypothetical protein